MGSDRSCSASPENSINYTQIASEKGLEFFNANTEGSKYELVMAFTSVPLPSSKCSWDIEEVHCNFWAKPEGGDTSSAQMFFASLKPNSEDDSSSCEGDQVLRCCILDPQPFPIDCWVYEDEPEYQTIYHPADVHCERCDAPNDCFQPLDDDDD